MVLGASKDVDRHWQPRRTWRARGLIGGGGGAVGLAHGEVGADGWHREREQLWVVCAESLGSESPQPQAIKESLPLNHRRGRREVRRTRTVVRGHGSVAARARAPRQ